MGMALVTKRVVREEQGNTVLAIHFTIKDVYPVVHYYKIERFSLKVGVPCMRVAELIKKDWSIML